MIDREAINVCASEDCRTTVDRACLFCESCTARMKPETRKAVAALLPGKPIMDRVWAGTDIAKVMERARVELARRKLKEDVKG